MIYNADLARRVIDYFANLHPLQPAETVQGALRLQYNLERALLELGGAYQGTLQPAAGAHSELVAILMIAAYHRARDNDKKIILIPDSAHGTNPATAAMAGYTVKEVKSDSRGRLDIDKLNSTMKEDGIYVAGIMMTQPSTLGIYDERLPDIAEIMHNYDAQLFCDGANFVALTGRVKLCDIGVDAYHMNLHKTLNVPHGGGGPGAGFVGVREHLSPYLPIPVVTKDGERYDLSYNRPTSIGIISPIHGNYLAEVMAYTYLLMLGSDGLREASGVAVLNGNYLRSLVGQFMPIAFPGYTTHEFVAIDRELKRMTGGKVTAPDLAKYVIDQDGKFYAPTVNFPNVSNIMGEEHLGCLLIEPTHSASKRAMDEFARALEEGARLGMENSEQLKEYPLKTPVRRLQEADSDRNPVWK